MRIYCSTKPFFLLVVLGLCCYTQAFSCCSEWQLLFLLYVQASHCSGLFCCGTQALGTQASVAEACGPVVRAHGLSCCTEYGIFSDQGIEPLSSSLAGRFPSTLQVLNQFLEGTKVYLCNNYMGSEEKKWLVPNILASGSI